MAWSDYLLGGSGGQTAEEQQANYARLRALEAQRIAARKANDSLTPEQEAFYNSNTDPLLNQNDAATQGFLEGGAEGWNNVLNFPGWLTGFLGKSTSQALGGILKNIPWWVYLALAGVAFVYLGGLVLLKGAFKKV
jgi:hypothetical protein